MLPKLEKVGLGWATFQVLRKTNASLSKKAGVDPKVASDQRGHGLGVSMEHYTFEQFVNEVYVPFCQRSWKESTAGTSEQIVRTHLPASVRTAAVALEEELVGKSAGRTGFEQVGF